jgi:ABC-type Fe3+-hydroxamate transport system substrate-binding protein
VAGGAALGTTVLLAACAGETETETMTTTKTVTGPGSTTTVTGPGSTVTVTGPGSTSTVTATQTVTETVEPTTVTVLNPEGQRAPIELQQVAPRLDTLDGKTIYLVDVHFTATQQLLEELEKLFHERMPNTTIVRKIKAGAYRETDDALWDEVETNADGWVMGTGH